MTAVMFRALEGSGAGIAVAAASAAMALIPVLAAYRVLQRYELSMLRAATVGRA